MEQNDKTFKRKVSVMKLTPKNALRVRKITTLVLSLLLFALSLLSAPYIALAIPPDLISPPEPVIAPLKADPLSSVSAPIESEPSDFSEPVSEPEESVPDSSDEPVSAPEGAIPVLSQSFCRYEPGETPKLYLNNETSLAIDLDAVLKQPLPVTLPADAGPAVLIIHTHGTESYLPEDRDYVSESDSFRSDDPEETVVAVGDVIAEVLLQNGIFALHDRTMYDKDDYNTAYVSASRATRKWLAKYPSIRFVLDIHRDSIFTEDGSCVKAVTEINGVQTAQIMLVAGSEADGSNRYYWQKNFVLAAHLQQSLGETYPTLARPLNLRSWAFNQNLCPGSLLLEVGSCGNTLGEAKNAARLFAEVYAALLQ